MVMCSSGAIQAGVVALPIYASLHKSYTIDEANFVQISVAARDIRKCQMRREPS